MLLSKQPGDTGVYATATSSRVSVYDLSDSCRSCPAPLYTAVGGRRHTHDTPAPVQDLAASSAPAPVPLWDPYTTLHPRWGCAIRPFFALPLEAPHLAWSGPSALRHAEAPISSRTLPSLTAASGGAFHPTSLSLSCATDKTHFFLSGDFGGGGGSASSGSGWIGSCDHSHLTPIVMSSRIGSGGSRAVTAHDYARAGSGPVAGERRSGSVQSGATTAPIGPSPSGASTPREGAGVGSVRSRRRLGWRSAAGQAESGSSIALASVPGAAEEVGQPRDDHHDSDESVEVSSDEDGGGDERRRTGSTRGESRGRVSGTSTATTTGLVGGIRWSGSAANLARSGSRHSLNNFSSATSPRAAGAAISVGNSEMPPPPLRPRARVLGPVSASGWDPHNAATLALGRQDGIVQLLDVEYLIGGADDAAAATPLTASGRQASTAHDPYNGATDAQSYALGQIHCSVVQERQLAGQVTAMDWVPQSHLTVVAARRQDGLGYFAELLDLRSPEMAVRCLGAPPEVIGTPFFEPSARAAGGGEGLGGDDDGEGNGGGAPLAGSASPYVLCYGEHVACDPSKRYVATVGTLQNKDIIQLWDVRLTTRPLSQKVFAKVGYTSLCWSAAEPLTVVGATRSGELRVHSFASDASRNRAALGRDGTSRGNGRLDGDAMRGRDGGGGGGDDDDEDLFPLLRRRGASSGVDDFNASAHSARLQGSSIHGDGEGGGSGQSHRTASRVHAPPLQQRLHGDRFTYADDNSDEDDDSAAGTATPSNTSFGGTATTASSLNGGDAAFAGGGSHSPASPGGAAFSPRMKSRSTRRHRLPARVPAAAVAWAVASPSGGSRGANGTMTAAIDPNICPIESGSRTDLPRLVLLNAKNGELYYQVYDRRGSTVTLYEALPLVAAGPNLFSVEVRNGLHWMKEARERTLLATMEACFAFLRFGTPRQEGGRGRIHPGGVESLLLRVVRRALASAAGSAGRGARGSALREPVSAHAEDTPAASVLAAAPGGAADGPSTGITGAVAAAAAAIDAGGEPPVSRPTGPFAAGGPSLPSPPSSSVAGAAAAAGGGGMPSPQPPAAVAKDYTGIDLLDDDDEDEDSTETRVSRNGRSVPGAATVGMGDTSSGGPTATTPSGVALRSSPQPQGADDAAHLPGAAGGGGHRTSPHSGPLTVAVSVPPPWPLLRGVRPEDADVFSYLLDVLPLCATLGFPDRRGLMVSRLASGFTTDPVRNLRVLEGEGGDREAYALFRYGLVVAQHLYGKPVQPARSDGGAASPRLRRRTPGGAAAGVAADAGHPVRAASPAPRHDVAPPPIVPIAQAVPGMLELLVTEHRERERLGLLDAPLPASLEDGEPQRQPLEEPVAAGGGAAGIRGGGWPSGPTTGLPGVLPGRGIGSSLRPPPPPLGLSAAAAGAAGAVAIPAMQPAPRAALGALRGLFLRAMGWTGETRRNPATAGAMPRASSGGAMGEAAAAAPTTEPRTAAAASMTAALGGDEPARSSSPLPPAATATAASPGRRRHTVVVTPNRQPRKRDPQSFFLDGEGIGLHSLQECIERRVCLLTLMDELSEAAELLALYGAFHPLYPSLALELSAAAAGKERRRAPAGGGAGTSAGAGAARKAAHASLLSILRGGQESGDAAGGASAVWRQPAVGCTFWLSLALTFVDHVVAVSHAGPAAPREAASASRASASTSDAITGAVGGADWDGAEDGWSMACMPLTEQRRFVLALLRCYPRLPLPDMLGLAVALLLPPRYTARHIDSLVEVMQALVHQQYEYGPVATATSTASSTAPLPTSVKQQQQQHAQEAAQLRELLSLTSRCSLLLTAAVEGVGVETAALQRYVDETTDVQTPLCYAAAFGYTQSSTFRTWREAYRCLLNANGHFMLRSQHDLQCVKTLKARAEETPWLRAGLDGLMRSGVGVAGVSGGGPGAGGGRGDGLKPPAFASMGGLADLTPPPGLVGGPLNSMMKRTLGTFSGGPPAVTPNARLKIGIANPAGAIGGPGPGSNPLTLGAMISANSSSNAAAAAAAACGYADPSRSVELRCNCGQAMHATAVAKSATAATASAVATATTASHARKQMVPCGNPECRQWQTPMCTVCGERMESRAMELPPERSFAWCTVCLHGGHYCHISEWFAKHRKCPVEDCPCQCCDAEDLS